MISSSRRRRRGAGCLRPSPRPRAVDTHSVSEIIDAVPVAAPQPSSGSTLARVIQPLDEPTFLREHWGAKPAVLRGDAGRFEGLFGLEELEEYLFIAHPTAGEVQIIRNGEW